MTEQTKAEAYVRSQRPALMELSFGCVVEKKETAFYWARIHTIVHYDLAKSVLVAREADGSTYTKKTLLKDYNIIGHPPQPHHWLSVLRENAEGDWMMKTSGEEHTVEFINITGYGTDKFKNEYMILGNINFYTKFCEYVNITG